MEKLRNLAYLWSERPRWSVFLNITMSFRAIKKSCVEIHKYRISIQDFYVYT